MNQADYDREIRKFSCRPRCCDWCQKRGFKAKPLFPHMVLRLDDKDIFRFWLHRECAQFLTDQEDVDSCMEVVVDPPSMIDRLIEGTQIRGIAYSETFYLRFTKELPYYNALNDLADAWGQEDYTSYNLLIGSMLDLWTEQNRFF